MSLRSHIILEQNLVSSVDCPIDQSIPGLVTNKDHTCRDILKYLAFFH